MTYISINIYFTYCFYRKWLLEFFNLFRIKTTCKSSISNPPDAYTMEFYTSILFHHLSFNPSLNNEIELIYDDKGKGKRRFLRYRNCKDTELTLPNFTFRALITAIKPMHLLEVVNILLFEHKILLIQNDPNSLALIIESLLLLLYPLYINKYKHIYSTWSFINISYLENTMTDYIDAPLPYIIGVPREIWKKIKKQRGKGLSWVPPDVSIFDLDKGVFKLKEKVPKFPENITGKIKGTLLEVIADVNSENIKDFQVN